MTESWRPPHFNPASIARGSSGGGSQTQTQQTILPDWLQSAAQQSLAGAQSVAAIPYQANPYQTVAPLTADQQQAYQTIQNLQGSTAPAYAAAQAAESPLLSQLRPETAAGISSDTASLMNPYTSAVVNPSVQLMQQQLQQSLGNIGAQASNVGAFGGSRQGVQAGVAQSQEALQAGQLSGGLLQSEYNQAQQEAQNIAGTNLGLGQWAAQLMPTQATAGTAATEQQAGLLEAVGRAEQGQTQAQSDLQASQFQDALNYPYQQQQVLEQALTSTPYGGTSITTGQKPYTNQAASIIGLGASGAALGGALGGAIAGGAAGSVVPGFGTAIGAGLGLMAGAFH